MKLGAWGMRFSVAAGVLLLGLSGVAIAGDPGSPPASASASTSASASASGSAAAVAAPEKWNDSAGFPPITSDDPNWGQRAAPATLVVFTDFQCPFCARLSKTVEELKAKYGPHRLRVVFKHMPLEMHKDAKAASVAGETVFRVGGSAAFWRFAAQVYNDQKNLDDARLSALTRAAGIDTKSVTPALIKQATKKVEADMALGKTIEVNGTPTSFVNGVEVKGSQTVEQFSKIIDEELLKADTARGSVRPDKLYVTLSKKAKAARPAKAKRPARARP